MNPAKALTGNFDLAFVLTYLLPLFSIALGFHILSSECEQGILPLLLTQPVSAAPLVAARLAFRLGLALALAGVGFGWAGVPPDGWVALSCLFWQGVVLLVTARQRSSAFNAVALLGAWLALLVLVPELLQVAVTAVSY